MSPNETRPGYTLALFFLLTVLVLCIESCVESGQRDRTAQSTFSQKASAK